MKKGQAWSMDLVIGVIIFLLAISSVYLIYSKKINNNTSELKISSEAIATKLVNQEETGLIINKQLNKKIMKKIITGTGISYEELKKKMGTKKDFCIFLEDDKGNLVNFTFYDDNNHLWTYNGIGVEDGKFNLSGSPCGKGSII